MAEAVPAGRHVLNNSHVNIRMKRITLREPFNWIDALDIEMY